MIEGVRERALAAGLADAEQFDAGIRDLAAPPKPTASSATPSSRASGNGAAEPMRRLHLAAGVLNAIAFVSSGAYMRFFVDPTSLAPGVDLLYISRHIYMLGPALVHLLLSAYVRPARARASRLQWAGTTLLIVSSTLLITAFVFEPIGGRGRTGVSAFGIFTLAAGVMLHVIAARLGRASAHRTLSDPVTYRMALPADVPRIVGLPREGEAGGDSRMLAYLTGQHHPQHALPPRVMWIARTASHRSGTLPAISRSGLSVMASCNGSTSCRNTGAARSARSCCPSRELVCRAGRASDCVDVGDDASRPFYRRHGAVELNKHWMVWNDVGAER